MPQFTTSTYTPKTGAFSYTCIYKPDDGLLCQIMNTPENMGLIQIIVEALNCCHSEDLIPETETPVAYLEYEIV